MNGKLNILHIAGGFAQHPLYVNLVQHLYDNDLCQIVFSPVRSVEEMSRQPCDQIGAIEYKFKHILRPIDRVFFRAKIKKIYHELCLSTDIQKLNIVHAHTLFSDGAVALRLKQKDKLPYIVAVRNTDVNLFMRYRPDLRLLGRRVLENASKVIFISPCYQLQLLSMFRGLFKKKIEAKSIIVPNGLSASWLNCHTLPERIPGSPLRLLYVGDLSRNKNIKNTIKAALILASRVQIQLTLVGGGNDQDGVLREISQRDIKFVRYVGRIDDREKLRAIYREHDIFVMPSFRETFGVVYLEALSQGLPVVHSLGQGIDGFFEPKTISEPVDPKDPHDIVRGIEALERRLPYIRRTCIMESQKFSWEHVAGKYQEIYRALTLRKLPVWK